MCPENESGDVTLMPFMARFPSGDMDTGSSINPKIKTSQRICPISVYITFNPQCAGYIPGRLFTHQSSRLLTAECRTSANVNTHPSMARGSAPTLYARHIHACPVFPCFLLFGSAISNSSLAAKNRFDYLAAMILIYEWQCH